MALIGDVTIAFSKKENDINAQSYQQSQMFHCIVITSFSTFLK